MIKILKAVYFFFKLHYLKLRFLFSINWIKTVYFNFKMLPFDTARKLPIYFYGSVKFTSLKGTVQIDAPIKRGMIGFGQAYEMTTRSNKMAEIVLRGRIIFRGYGQFGKDVFLMVDTNAILDFGAMAGVASRGKLICTHEITFKTYARIGSECQIFDTDFHQMINTVTGNPNEKSKPITIGAYNYVGRWSSLLKGTVTPDYCTIASNTLCNKDYTHLGNNILIGGIPAKLLKKNISRDWEGEREMMEKNLILKNRF
ncbi:MAG: transferase [Gelidibacter sp.]